MAYTTIDDPSAYFQTVLWTGDGSAGNAITFDGNSDMQPDFVWSKNRTNTTSNILKDTSRGGTSNNDLHLLSDSNSNEGDYNVYRMDFDSDGFTLDGAGDTGFQGSGTSMVSWSWKANGSTKISVSASGAINAGTYQANTTAGFSIVEYTGEDNVGDTVTHGLGAVPHFILVKNLSNASDWAIYHHKNTSAPETDRLLLNTGVATADDATYWSDVAPTSSVFTVGTDIDTGDADDYVAYLWTEIQGFSKFGSFIGNGNANGPFVYTGFKPGWIMWTNSNNTSAWYMYDSKRNTYNGATNYLSASTTALEATGGGLMDFLSNGFKVLNTGSDMNVDDETTVYVAFAEQPFVTAGGIPATAR